MKSLSQYITESGSDKAVKNVKFRKLMKAAGFDKIELVKGQGYFYITSDDTEMWKLIYNLPEINIYINSFNQMPPEDWVKEIERLIADK